MADATKTAILTYVMLQTGERLYCTEPYEDVRDRVIAARDGMLTLTADRASNPLSFPLVNVRIAIRYSDNEDDVGAVDCCFNPMFVVAMYRAHPDV